MRLKMEENRAHWGRNSNRDPKLLTGLGWCPNCGKKLKYAGGRTIPSVVCTTRGCISRYKCTHESLIVEAINKALANKAEQLGQHITEEPPEAAALRDQIHRLQKLNDPDLDDVIKAKQQKLTNLLATASPTDRSESPRSPSPRLGRWRQEELRMIYLEFVSRVEADRGQVVSVALKI